jgi:hypothetical protein
MGFFFLGKQTEYIRNYVTKVTVHCLLQNSPVLSNSKRENNKGGGAVNKIKSCSSIDPNLAIASAQKFASLKQ